MKVNCRFCQYEEDSKCTKKKCSVRLNKRRSCTVYKEDVDKVMVYTQNKRFTSKPEVMNVDSRIFHDRELRRHYRKKIAQEELDQYGTTADVAADVNTPQITGTSNLGSKHPMTGDLSRFVSSAAEEKKDG